MKTLILIIGLAILSLVACGVPTPVQVEGAKEIPADATHTTCVVEDLNTDAKRMTVTETMGYVHPWFTMETCEYHTNYDNAVAHADEWNRDNPIPTKEPNLRLSIAQERNKLEEVNHWKHPLGAFLVRPSHQRIICLSVTHNHWSDMMDKRTFVHVAGEPGDVVHDYVSESDYYGYTELEGCWGFLTNEARDHFVQQWLDKELWGNCDIRWGPKGWPFQWDTTWSDSAGSRWYKECDGKVNAREYERIYSRHYRDWEDANRPRLLNYPEGEYPYDTDFQRGRIADYDLEGYFWGEPYTPSGVMER